MFLRLFWFLVPLYALWFADAADAGADDGDSSENSEQGDGDEAGGDEATTSKQKQDNRGNPWDRLQADFTQDELNAIFAGRDKTSKNAILKALGVDDLEAAKKALKEAADARKAQMTELEAARAERDEANAAKEQAETSAAESGRLANERLMRAAVIVEASKAEHRVDEKAVRDVWQFVDREQLAVDEAGDVSGVEAAVKAVLKARPYMLKPESDKTPPGGPDRRRKSPGLQWQRQQQNGTQQTNEPARPNINF